MKQEPINVGKWTIVRFAVWDTKAFSPADEDYRALFLLHETGKEPGRYTLAVSEVSMYHDEAEVTRIRFDDSFEDEEEQYEAILEANPDLSETTSLAKGWKTLVSKLE